MGMQRRTVPPKAMPRRTPGCKSSAFTMARVRFPFAYGPSELVEFAGSSKMLVSQVLSFAIADASCVYATETAIRETRPE